MKVILLHPGTQYSQSLARELVRLNLLRKYITSFTVSETSTLTKVFGDKLKNRIFKGIQSRYVKIYPIVELIYWLESSFSKDNEYLLFKRNLRFQNKVIRNDLNGNEIVIGFDTSSWMLADHCLQKRKEFILDVSIGHAVSKQRIFKKLQHDFPLWTDSAPLKSAELISLEEAEFRKASKIVVPSNFVKGTLVDNNVDASKIFVNPFGTDLPLAKPIVKGLKDKVTFLFFGALTARKGLPVLLKAWSAVENENVRLIVAGYGHIPKGEKIPGNVEILGAIAPENRDQLYDNADVFIFPSFFEGFAQVQVEAAARGLPIIGTKNSGAEELVKDGYSGFIVEPGNVEQLVTAIRFFSINRDQLKLMSARIRENIDFFSWKSYGDRWAAILESKINKAN